LELFNELERLKLPTKVDIFCTIFILDGGYFFLFGFCFVLKTETLIFD